MTAPLRVLIVEDNQQDADLMILQLTRANILTDWRRVETEEAYLAALESPPDLILADWHLPQFSGLRAVRLLKERDLDIPFIIISGSIGEEAAIDALRSGADDYVLKDRPVRLSESVRRALHDQQQRAARRSAEQALRESEDRFRRMAEQAPDLIYRYEFTPTRGFTYVSPAATAITGYTPEEHYADPDLGYKIIHPDDRHLLAAAERADHPRGQPVILRWVRRNGEVIWTELRNVMISDAQGNLVAIEGIARDITARRHAEQALEESEMRLGGIVSSAMDAIISIDDSQRIVLFNPAAERMFECSAAMAIGQPVERFIPEAHRGDHHAQIVNFGRTGATARTMGRLGAVSGLRWGGEIFPIEASISHIEVSGQHLYTVIMRDITARRQAEEAIRQRLTELESLHTISAALRTTDSRDAALTLLLDAALAALGADSGAIWIYDADQGELRAAVDRGWFRQVDRAPLRPSSAGDVVFATGRAHRSHEFRSDPLVHERFRSQAPAGASGVCLPLRTAGADVMGMLFASVPAPRQIADDQIKLLESLAEMSGAALHRMSLYDETVRQLDRLQALHRIDQAIGSSTDIRMTLDVLLDHVTSQLGVDAAAIYLLGPNTQTLSFAVGRGFRGGALRHTRLQLGAGYAGRAALDRRRVHVPDLRGAETDLQRAAAFAAEGFVAYHALPLIAKGQVKGVLEVFHRAPLPAERHWVGFLETLAGQAAIAIDSAQLFEHLQRSNVELALAYDATIEGWSRAMDLRDKETEGHTLRVTDLAIRLAQAIGIDDAEIIHIRRGALLHDIGKIGVPDSILLKPGPLTDEEWVVMRGHPQLAYEMLAPISYLRPALDIPYCHHEKWDGSGYPRGLRGEQIPLAARLFAAVDVWDALRSDRPYRSAWPEERAFAHIRSLAGTHFDPHVAEVFLHILHTRDPRA